MCWKINGTCFTRFKRFYSVPIHFLRNRTLPIDRIIFPLKNSNTMANHGRACLLTFRCVYLSSRQKNDVCLEYWYRSAFVGANVHWAKSLIKGYRWRNKTSESQSATSKCSMLYNMPVSHFSVSSGGRSRMMHIILWVGDTLKLTKKDFCKMDFQNADNRLGNSLRLDVVHETPPND